MCVPEITTLPSTASPFLSSGSSFEQTEASAVGDKKECGGNEYLDGELRELRN